MEIVNRNGIAVATGDGHIITDVQSAVDLIGNSIYQAQSYDIIINKANIADGFFKLSTGLLGDVLQKFANYGVRLAIVGDFSNHTSKPLRDFICESNKGGRILFVADEQTAVERLKAEYKI